jgi:hypothetical protein
MILKIAYDFENSETCRRRRRRGRRRRRRRL